MSDRSGSELGSETASAPEIPPKLRRLLDAFTLVPDRAERIGMLIGIAERFRGVPEEVAPRPYSEAHKVPACESEAYVYAVPRQDGTLKFHVAVENPQGISARAMAVILDETLSGAPLEQVARVPRDIPMAIFGNELSMGKSMGLMGMVAMVQMTAKKALAAGGS